MSFAPKTDWVGLGDTAGLALRSNAENAQNTVIQIHGADGTIIGDEQTQVIRNPTCEYAISGVVNLSSIMIGNCYNKPYAVSRVQVTTAAGGEPVVNADAVQIENGAERTVCVYKMPSIQVTPARHALTFGSVTYEESPALALQSGEFECNGNIQPATVDGVPIASDAIEGTCTVNLSFWSSSDTVQPTVTVDPAWHITTPWTCTGADSSMFTWTVGLSRYLSATV